MITVAVTVCNRVSVASTWLVSTALADHLTQTGKSCCHDNRDITSSLTRTQRLMLLLMLSTNSQSERTLVDLFRNALTLLTASLRCVAVNCKAMFTALVPFVRYNV